MRYLSLFLLLILPLAGQHVTPKHPIPNITARDTENSSVMTLRAKAMHGDAMAQSILGLCYEQGLGTPLNPAEAMNWYLKAAQQGNVWAQFKLGENYTQGLGTPKNSTEAMKWYRKAAEQGNTQAQIIVGDWYFKGRGVLNSSPLFRPRSSDDFTKAVDNFNEAVKWYLKAADQGDAKAQFKLGLAYSLSMDTTRNYAEAYVWFRLSAANGWAADPEFSADSAKHLSPQALAQAEEKAQKVQEEIRARTRKP